MFVVYSPSKHASLFPQEAAHISGGFFFVDENKRVLVAYRPLGTVAEVSLSRNGDSSHLGKEFWQEFYGMAAALGFSQLTAEVENPRIEIYLKRQRWTKYENNNWYINVIDKL